MASHSSPGQPSAPIGHSTEHHNHGLKKHASKDSIDSPSSSSSSSSSDSSRSRRRRRARRAHGSTAPSDLGDRWGPDDAPPPYEAAINAAPIAEPTSSASPAADRSIAGGQHPPNYPQQQQQNPNPLSSRDEKHPQPSRSYDPTHLASLTLTDSAPAHRPIVIPQRDSTPNATTSPFIRAYAPSLASHDITAPQFLSFIDGLNEAWLSAAPFQAADAASAALAAVPYGPAKLAALGVGLASRSGAALVSSARAKSYLAAANNRFLHPRGLHARMLRTPAMCAAAGAGAADALHASRDAGASSAAGAMAPSDALARLGGRVARLETQVPAAPQDAWFAKVGAWAAGRRDERAARRDERRAHKVAREERKEARRARRDEAKGRAPREHGKAERRREKYARKQDERVRGLYWVVVASVEGVGDLEDEGDVSDEDRVEKVDSAAAARDEKHLA